MALFGQYGPKFGLSLANFVGCWNSWKSRKNLKVGGFETDFKQVPFVFRQTTSTYSESWGPVENLGQKIWVKKIFPLILPKNIVSLLKIDFD